MTDLEITKLCAEAIGTTVSDEQIGNDEWAIAEDDGRLYDPLCDDAQAMALVKKFHPSIGFSSHDQIYHLHIRDAEVWSWSKDLNRAICECVAKMRSTKESQ